MISFEKEKEKLKKVKTLSEFFEVKRQILHKIVDGVRDSNHDNNRNIQYLCHICEAIDEWIDICYRHNIPDDIYALHELDNAIKNLCDELIVLEEEINTGGFNSIKLTDIPIFSQTCPFCMVYFPECDECPYAEKHGCCGDDESDWEVMRGLFDELLS